MVFFVVRVAFIAQQVQEANLAPLPTPAEYQKNTPLRDPRWQYLVYLARGEFASPLELKK